MADFLGQNAPDPTPEALRGLRDRMGLGRADFGRLVGLSERSVASWESGTELKAASLRKIVEIARLYDRLRASFPSAEELGRWLKTSNTAFEGSTPLQVIERGEIDRLWQMVYLVESGTPS